MPTALSQLPPLELPRDLQEKPPLGPEGVRHGQLENGMRYYVLPLKKPQERAALALAVDVGSVLEEDQERGVAHIVEHLAFNATAKFESHEIVRFLESIGAQFGACTNAYTSADETVYELLVPTDDEKFLAQALDVFAQFAVHTRCSEGDLAKERGAVLEELRLGKGVAGRIQEAQWKLITQGSQYADRLPIGVKSVIEQMPASMVQNFYRRWYRPERMAVIAVGDFSDPDRVVALLTAALGSTRVPHDVAPAERPQFTFVPHAQPQARVIADKEASKAQVVVSWQKPGFAIATYADYRRNMVEELFLDAFGTRCFKRTRLPKPPFFQSDAGGSSVCRAIFSHYVTAICSTSPAAVLEALEALLVELARVRLHGFSAREVRGVKAAYLAGCENMYEERHQMHSTGLRAEYARHFLTGEMVAGQAAEAQLGRAFLEGISDAEVGAVAAALTSADSCIVKATAHRRVVSEAQLLAVMAKVDALEAAGEIGPEPSEQELPSLMPPGLGPPGAITERRELAAFGATQLTLSNGLRVTYKQTDFLDDQLLVNGFAHGGLSEAPRNRRLSALFSAGIALEAGHFGFKPEVFNEVVMGMRVDLGVGMDAFSRSVGGECSPADLEPELQLLHRLFTSPLEPDAAVIDTCVEVSKENVRAEDRNPHVKFSQHLNKVLYSDCYFYRPFTTRDVDNFLDVPYACDFYRRAFANPGAFILVIVGNVQAPELERLAERYLASIPVPQGAPPPRPIADITPLPFAIPQQLPRVETVRARMLEPSATATINFPIGIALADPLEGMKESLRVFYLCQLLQTKLLQKLRFEQGQIYSLSAQLSMGPNSPAEAQLARGYVAVTFSCEGASAERLVDATLAEVERLQSEGVSQEEADTLLLLEQRQWETLQQENGFWLDTLMSLYRGRLFAASGDVDAVYRMRLEARTAVREELSRPEALQSALVRVLQQPVRERHIILTLLPRGSVWSWLARRLRLSQPEGERRPWLGWAVGAAALSLGVVATVLVVQRRRLDRSSTPH